MLKDVRDIWNHSTRVDVSDLYSQHSPVIVTSPSLKSTFYVHFNPDPNGWIYVVGNRCWCNEEEEEEEEESWRRINICTTRVSFNQDFLKFILEHMEAFEPKWVNPVLNIIGVNSFRLGGLQILLKWVSFFG